MTRRLATLVTMCAASLAGVAPALGCAVCFGEKDSPLTKGADAGILVLLGILSVVLTGVVSFAGFVIYRTRQLRRAALAESTITAGGEAAPRG